MANRDEQRQGGMDRDQAMPQQDQGAQQGMKGQRQQQQQQGSSNEEFSPDLYQDGGDMGMNDPAAMPTDTGNWQEDEDLSTQDQR